METLKYLLGAAAGFAIVLFARRWHELKQKEAKLQSVELTNQIEKAHEKTNTLSTDDLVDRENERFLSGFYKHWRK